MRTGTKPAHYDPFFMNPKSFTVSSLSRRGVGRSVRRAFTLVELLTVIAVIAILMAILFPLVGMIRESANRSTCGSNLRQIALAVLSYANDNGGFLPSGRGSATGNYTGLYRRVEDPSHEPNGVIMADHSQMLSSHIARYITLGRSKGVWRCPSNNAMWDAMDNASKSTYLINNQSSTIPSYFFGSFLLSHGTAGSPIRSPKSLRTELRAGAAGNQNFATHPNSGVNETYGPDWSTVREPNRIWMIADMDSGNYGGMEGVPSVTAANAVRRPHKDGRNYVFFDGHVEWRAFNNAPANP